MNCDAETAHPMHFRMGTPPRMSDRTQQVRSRPPRIDRVQLRCSCDVHAATSRTNVPSRECGRRFRSTVHRKALVCAEAVGMPVRRLTFIYLATYLLVGGGNLLVAPDLALRLLLSNGAYGDIMPRLFGLFMFVLDRKSTRLNSSHLGISYA